MCPEEIRVQLREQHLYYQDHLLPVNRIVMHPNYYTPENGADIALLELEDPVNVSAHVQPVTLPPALQTFPMGTLCWVTGWGDVHSGSECEGRPEGGVSRPPLGAPGRLGQVGSPPDAPPASPRSASAAALPPEAGQGPHRGEQYV